MHAMLSSRIYKPLTNGRIYLQLTSKGPLRLMGITDEGFTAATNINLEEILDCDDLYKQVKTPDWFRALLPGEDVLLVHKQTMELSSYSRLIQGKVPDPSELSKYAPVETQEIAILYNSIKRLEGATDE